MEEESLENNGDELRAFEVEQNRIRGDFNDYTSYVRTKAIQFALGMIAVNWAIFGKSGDCVNPLTTAIHINQPIRWSILFCLLSLGINLLYSFVYSLLLSCMDKRIQIDFMGDKKLFKDRHNPESHYPYLRGIGEMALVVDLLVLIYLACSVGNLLCAIGLTSVYFHW